MSARKKKNEREKKEGKEKEEEKSRRKIRFSAKLLRGTGTRCDARSLDIAERESLTGQRQL